MTAWPLSALGMQIVPFSTLLLAGVDGVVSKCEALLVDIIPGRLLSLALPVADCRGRREAILILMLLNRVLSGRNLMRPSIQHILGLLQGRIYRHKRSFVLFPS
jgi:hypothetical protein